MMRFDSYMEFLNALLNNEPEAKDAEALCSCNRGEADCKNCEGGIAIHCPALYDDVKEG